MGRTKRLAKNTLFVFIGNIGSKLMSFIMLPLYTSWLSPADYGITDIISTYSVLLLNIIACDVSDAIFVFPVGATQEKIRSYYSSGFFFQLFCSITAAIFFFIFSNIESANSFFSYSWFIYGVLISSLFQKYTQDFCRGINKMSVFSFTGIINSGTIALFSILLIPQWGINGYVTALITANIVTSIFTFFYSKSYRYLSLHSISCNDLKEMLRFSIPLMPTAIMWWLISGMNRPLLEEFHGLFAVGLLAVASKLPSIMNLVFGFFQQAWLVTAIEEYKKDDFCQYYNKLFKVIFSCQILACIIITIAAKPFILMMTTSQYIEAWKYIPLLAIAAIFSNISAYTGAIFSATRKTQFTFYSVIIGGLSSLIANFALIPAYGLLGACLAIIIGHMLSSFSRIYFSAKFIKFKNHTFLIIQLIIIIICYLCSFIQHPIYRILTYIINTLFFIFYNKSLLLEAIIFIKNKKSNKKISNIKKLK